VDWKI